MMKRLFLFLLIGVLLVSLTACGGAEKPDGSDPETSASESSAPAEPTEPSDPADPDESEDPDTSTEPGNSSTSGKKTTVGGKKTTAGKKTTTKKTTYVTTKRTGKPTWETPVTFNTAILWWEQHSSYDAQAEKKRLEIVRSASEVGPSKKGTTYYISPTGNDKNDGKSQLTPWKTAKPLDKASLKSGDVVLFERNAVYRDTHVVMTPGVSYGAYGDGPKPALYGSRYNYADRWVSAGTHLWKCQLDPDITNVGNIVFDHGKSCAVLRLENKLAKDFEFYEDKEKHVLYLYLSKGDPGKLYSDIEVVDVRGILHGAKGRCDHTTVDNLCLKYAGSFAIDFIDCTGCTATNCEIGYIGGSELAGTQRFVRQGNGITYFGNCLSGRTEHNWIYQCYDAGLSNQGGKGFDLTFTDNLIEYCQYNIEVWSHGSARAGATDLYNCRYTNNILRFAGYNFEHSNRMGSNTSVAGHISMYDYIIPSDDRCVISGNVFDTSYRYLLCMAYPNDPKRGMKVTGNTWIQNAFNYDEADFATIQHNPTRSPVGFLKGESGPKTILYADSQKQMEESVKQIDTAPVKIVFDGTQYMK